VSIRRFLRNIKRKLRELLSLRRRLDVNTMLLAQLHVDRIRRLNAISSLREAEFKAFSQGGEDGIIQFLISNVPIENKVFIEFGVETYVEANTRFLLLNDDWKGLVIDGSNENVNQIRNDGVAYAAHDLSALCSFITRENIDELFKKAGFSGDIGLLSIDVDGNDYWIWESIRSVSPRIVVCEYNSIFGPNACVTIPYDPSFERSKAHYSCLYFGASLSALCHLASNKGYDFVGSNSMGTNAFFVRKDFNHKLQKLTAREGYVSSTNRMDSRDIHNNNTFVGGAERLKLVQDFPVVDILTNKTIIIKELVNK
jgi:hypothetical protein